MEGEGVCVLFRCVCFFQGGGGVFFSFLGEGRRGVFLGGVGAGEGVICSCVFFFWERCVFFGRRVVCVCGVFLGGMREEGVVLFGRDEGGVFFLGGGGRGGVFLGERCVFERGRREKGVVFWGRGRL